MKPTKGTPARGPSLLDSNSLHLVEPLHLDDSLATSAEGEEILVREALLRGARELDVMEYLARRRQRALARSPAAAPSRLGLSLSLLSEPEGLSPANVVSRLAGAYRDMAQQEFDAFPGNVQTAFRAMTVEKNRDLPKDKKIQPFDYYLDLRVAYYQAGYDDPVKDIFSKITPAKLLGHDIVFGVHEKFLAQLAGLDKLLNSWSPGLADRTAKEIARMDGGFVPRYIAPKQGQSQTPVLSNHAFGMAVDIDPDRNPHIKDRDVMDALKQAIGYDFGASFVEYSKQIPDLDRIAQIHLRAQDASGKLQRWLQTYLPRYREAERSGALRASFADADTERIWWTDAGVHQNLTFAVQPDPISGMHCWHQAVRIRKAEAGDHYGDIAVDAAKSRAAYREWMAKTRPASTHSPDGTRRPYWMLRPLKPSREVYRR